MKALILTFALSLAVAALADINGTSTLASGSTLNLDTGETVSSGGDILWNGSSIAPQGKAKAYNFGNLGTIGFNGLGQTQLSAVLLVASSSPIQAGALVVGDVFGVRTNGANLAKVLVTANGGGSITLQFVTYVVAAPTGPSGPNVTAVLNNSSLIPDGTPSSGIAPSSIFVVKGTGLADLGDPLLQSSADPGLPLTLNGASLTVVVNGTTLHPALYYTSPTQLAAVLPANTPIGTGTLTVDYKGASSSPFTIQVVAHSPGINFYYSNTGVATDATSGALLTFTSSGAPGEIITLWTTGLGADPADSDTVFTTTPHQVDTPVQVYIGGVAANVLYHGSAGYPGVNQINLTIPDSAPTGCWIPIAVVAGGVLGNVATLPINPGGGVCIDQLSGLNGNQIAPPAGQTIRGGLVALIKTNEATAKGGRRISDVTDAAFEKYTGVYQPAYSLSPGGCLVRYVVAVPIPEVTGLDVGSISLTGPERAFSHPGFSIRHQRSLLLPAR